MAQPASVIEKRFPNFREQVEQMRQKVKEKNMSYKNATSDEWQEEFNKRFSYHAPSGDQPQMYEELRRLARELAYAIVVLTPECREASLALTNLEQALFWANSAIARYPEEVGPGEAPE